MEEQEEQHQKWWQKNKRLLIITIIAIFIAFALLVYWFGWDWTGLSGFNGISVATDVATTPQKITRTIVYQVYQPGKTLWDWLQLLIIPAVLAVAGFWFNYRERKAAELRADNERKGAEDNQREEALQAYLRTMSELIFERHLQHKEPMAIGWPVARAHTLTVLSRLDANRKRSILLFLRETELIIKEDDNKCTDHIRGKLELHGADLSGANLRNLKLDKKTNLSETNLTGADLSEANLTGADLSKANLSKANLSGSDLNGANLSDAIVSDEQLASAQSLKGAIMPDGSIHP